MLGEKSYTAESGVWFHTETDDVFAWLEKRNGRLTLKEVSYCVRMCIQKRQTLLKKNIAVCKPQNELPQVHSVMYCRYLSTFLVLKRLPVPSPCPGSVHQQL